MKCISKKQLRSVLAVATVMAIGTLVARRLGYKVGGNCVVRCRQGHLFTTLWIPGIKLKAIDLGIARIQHCPVGHHWSLVVPVRDADLTEEERRTAGAHHDARIPCTRPLPGSRAVSTRPRGRRHRAPPRAARVAPPRLGPLRPS